MKHIYAIVFFMSLFFQAEKYYVTFVKGKPFSKRTGTLLKVGEAVLPSDNIRYGSTDTRVMCISPGRGRFELRAKKTASGELWALIKTNIVPILNNYHFSTRGLGFAGYDPATYFQSAETGDRILIVSNQSLPIAANYKRDAYNFFFLQYTVNGKRVTQKIEQNDAGILFNLQTFSATTANELPGKVLLCYQSADSGTAKSTAITEFVPVLLTKEELRQQLQVIKTYAGITDQKKLRAEVAAHLYDNYGKIGDTEFITLLQ